MINSPDTSRDKGYGSKSIIANIAGFFRTKNIKSENKDQDFPFDSLKSYKSFLSFCRNNAKSLSDRRSREDSLVVQAESFCIPGLCAVCAKEVPFHMDFLYAGEQGDGARVPNWRERVVCPECGLNNRMRAILHFLTSTIGAGRESSIYITEQATHLYQAFEARFDGTVGSEFLRDGTPRGECNALGIRNEDATALTFPDERFDCIVTADVLEHIPEYQRALAEFHRCLKPGGHLLVSVPFVLESEETIVRARINESGEVEHLLPPEYHGDPLDAGGVLCFYHFGWDFIEKLRNAGFRDCALQLYWSDRFGYLGSGQFIISARKPSRPAWKDSLTRRLRNSVRNAVA